MLVLYETAMGFALFKLTDSAKLTDPNLHKEFETPERANSLCVQPFQNRGMPSPDNSGFLLCSD
jgi:NOP5NT (NUC127) domain